MEKAPIVVSRICKGNGGFGPGGEKSACVDLHLGCRGLGAEVRNVMVGSAGPFH